MAARSLRRKIAADPRISVARDASANFPRSESSMRITMDVPDSDLRRLEETARQLEVSPEALAAAVIHDLLTRDDAEFARVADRVLKKNADLYRRLA